ncbi:hypothetical protein M2175_004631 [Bradyrhizobium elkanii]|nr:hypothetical protein [Bradyrhizobium elkanii]MCS3970157.1 hypothetical protein [Bradyrhizobium japonicum]
MSQGLVQLSIAIVISSCILATAIIFGGRYTAIPAGTGTGSVWRIDRLSGDMAICVYGSPSSLCLPVTNRAN